MCRTQLLEVLARVYRRIVRRLSPLFQEKGLSPTEAMVLWGVYRRGSLRATELAGELGIPPSTFTGVFDRLVEKGLLRRVPDPEDKRGVRVEPTPALFPFMEEMKGQGGGSPGRPVSPLSSPSDGGPSQGAERSFSLPGVRWNDGAGEIQWAANGKLAPSGDSGPHRGLHGPSGFQHSERGPAHHDAGFQHRYLHYQLGGDRLYAGPGGGAPERLAG